ncbi:hypothetical protein FB45DRAFT_897415 [Roridomyces roridus]|uniref:GST N-terminal domain-containing protein n=1 Tax=Roridomyces roridus TaxID=1738132 RepID=A0AAD7CBA5_9AGAR|nr:hypothetical protein FB45DRAFT_897415 [Roridomyces roridus]
MPTEPILFYDIPSNAPGVAWSNNAWIIRYALNLKGLAYKTIWVEFSEIADTLKAIGAEPSMIRKDGSPFYSIPVIQDPDTGTTVSESLRIAAYLDAAYPETHKLVPAGTYTLQKGFRFGYDSATGGSIPFIMPAVARILRPRSAEYFVRAREEEFQKKLTEVTPTGEEREVAWNKFKMGFERVAKWMKEGEPYIMGESITYSDLVIAAEMQWFRAAFGKESEEWKDIETWQGGRWAKLVSDLKKYEGPPEEGPVDN